MEEDSLLRLQPVASGGDEEERTIRVSRTGLFIFFALICITTLGGVCAGMWLLFAEVPAEPPAVAGIYRCEKVKVGNQERRCKLPLLILKDDGTYKIWNEEGTYSVLDSKFVVLSGSWRRGLGQLVKPNLLIFEYTSDGRKHVVTFKRRELPPVGTFSV